MFDIRSNAEITKKTEKVCQETTVLDLHQILKNEKKSHEKKLFVWISLK